MSSRGQFGGIGVMPVTDIPSFQQLTEGYEGVSTHHLSPCAYIRFRKTASEKTRAPSVLGMLKRSYSSRPPILPICACAPTPQANAVPRSEKARKGGRFAVPLGCRD